MKKTIASIVTLLTIVLLPTQSIFALSINTSAAAKLNSEKVGMSAEVKASTTGIRITNGKDRATKEIDRRVKSLTDLTVKISNAKRLSVSQKSSLTASIQTEVTSLNTLMTKINADVDIATLKVDIASITKSYRVYMVIMPQARIAIAGDSLGTTVDTMTQVGTKFQTRIASLDAAGKNTTDLKTWYADYSAKLVSANTEIAAAINGTATLKADNGDKTVMQANAKAFADARAKIKAAQSDIKAARADAEKIVKALKALNVSVTATTTANVQ